MSKDKPTPPPTSSKPAPAKPEHEFKSLHLGIWKCERCGYQATGTSEKPYPNLSGGACYVAPLAEPVKTP